VYDQLDYFYSLQWSLTIRDIYVHCEMLLILFVLACDPNCRSSSGCDEQGEGKCDEGCKTGYILSREYTCLGKWIFYVSTL